MEWGTLYFSSFLIFPLDNHSCHVDDVETLNSPTTGQSSLGNCEDNSVEIFLAGCLHTHFELSLFCITLE